MDTNRVIAFILVGICIYIISVHIGHIIERKRLLGLLDRLTDKLMSRDFSDYSMGQSIKSDINEPVEYKPRTDKAESVIEQMNNEAVGLESKLKHLDKDMEKVG